MSDKTINHLTFDVVANAIKNATFTLDKESGENIFHGNKYPIENLAEITWTQ